MEALRRAVALQPNATDARNALGLALMDAGSGEEAVSTFRALLAAHPDDATARHNLGSALLHQGDLDGAIAVYRELVRAAPEDAEAFYNLGHGPEAEGRFRGRRWPSCAAPSRSIPRCTTRTTRWAWCSGRPGRPDEAVAAFRDAIARKPDLADAHYMLGTILRQQGRLDDALAAFREAIRLRPEAAEGHLSLGQVLQQKGDRAGAAEAFAEAQRLQRQKGDAQAAPLPPATPPTS